MKTHVLLFVAIIVTVVLVATASGLLLWRLIRPWFAQSLSRHLKSDDDVDATLSMAIVVALKRGDDEVESSHFLGAAVANPEVAAAFRAASLIASDVRVFVASQLGPVAEEATEPIPISKNLQRAIRRAQIECFKRRRARVTLMAVLREVLEADGPLGQFLRHSGVRLDDDAPAAAHGAQSGGEHYAYVCNDPTSPMIDVVRVLEQAFEYSYTEALYLMIVVHYTGFAAVGPYSAARAKGLVEAAKALAHEMGLPLQIAMEAPDTAPAVPMWMRQRPPSSLL